MQLEIVTEGVECVVSRAPRATNDGGGRHRADGDTGELLLALELVALDDAGADVIKVTATAIA